MTIRSTVQVAPRELGNRAPLRGAPARSRITVAYRGNFRPPWSTENHVAASLEALGHTVVRLQEDQDGWDRVLEAGLEADLVLWTKTWIIDPARGFEVLKVLDRAGVPTASFHLDLYVGLEREAQIPDDPFWHVKHSFTADGDPEHQKVFRRYGVNHTPIRPGVLDTECVPGTPRPEYRCGVAFVGSWEHYHREHPWRRQLVEWLRQTYGARFGLWPAPRQPVRGMALNDLYASATVVVGDSCNPGFALRRFWSDRAYETVGRGGFLVHPLVEGLEEDFDDGEHLRFHRPGDLAGLKDLIDHYLAHPEQARAIADQGQAHVKAHHTYRHRMSELLSTLAEREPSLREGSPARTSAAPVVRRGWRGTFRPGTTDAQVFGEVWTQNIYRLYPDQISGAIVVDVGANIGAFTARVAALGAHMVHAYEPEPANFAALVANVKACSIADRVVAQRLALAGASGRVIPHVADPGRGGGNWTEPGRGEGSVEAIPLAAVLRTLPRVGLLKIDVEGAEAEILLACPHDLLARVANLVVEFHAGLHAPSGRILPSRLGALVEHLSETHRVEVAGRASTGGLLFCRSHA